MRRFLIVLLALVLLCGLIGCVGSNTRSETTSELGAVTRAERITSGYGPGWRITMPVVHRNREPKAANPWAALESMAGAGADIATAMKINGTVLAGFGLADSVSHWVVPDLSETQNVVLDFDGLATSVTISGLEQRENADGTVSSIIGSLTVTADSNIKLLSGETATGGATAAPVTEAP